MKLFKHSSGVIFSFGFDMFERGPDKSIICWSGRDGRSWAAGKNDSDWQRFAFDVAPEFITEVAGGHVLAYQPGRCIMLSPVVGREVFRIQVLEPHMDLAAAA